VKQKLQGLIAPARELEARELTPLVNDEAPASPGQWTAKDHLAHIVAWREVAAAEFEALRTGVGPPDISNDDDLENAKIYERTHDMPAAALIDDSRHAWNALAAELERASEADLAKPRARWPEETYGRVIVNHTLTHLAEHLGYVHRDRRDEKAAEALARWARDQAAATFPGERQEGVSEYNLGCFYAVRGRAAEAIPHLRRGVELVPGLRDWAQQDSDLDPIRDSPELGELLA
jgi:tetratricopeptide (TPR) repeat protein